MEDEKSNITTEGIEEAKRFLSQLNSSPHINFNTIRAWDFVLNWIIKVEQSQLGKQ